MLTVLEQSVKGGRIRGSRTIRFGSSNNQPNKLTKTFWSLESNVRKSTLLRYLSEKAILGLCSQLELRCLYDWPGVLEDDLFIAALRATRLELPMDLLFKRIAWMQRLEDTKEFSQNDFWTLEGVVNLHIIENRVTIRKGKKFSGYVRNSSSVGSKSSKVTYIPEPESFEWRFDVKKDYFQFFSVGEFVSGGPGSIALTPMMTKAKVETEPKQKRKK